MIYCNLLPEIRLRSCAWDQTVPFQRLFTREPATEERDAMLSACKQKHPTFWFGDSNRAVAFSGSGGKFGKPGISNLKPKLKPKQPRQKLCSCGGVILCVGFGKIRIFWGSRDPNLRSCVFPRPHLKSLDWG